MYQNVVYYQNGTMAIIPLDDNQPVQGNGRYVVPQRFGGTVRRIDTQSSEGSTSTIWDIKWSEPWRGSV